MWVQAVERLDENTILCKVSWDSPADKSMFRITVPVKATVEEYTAPVRHGDGFVLRDAPSKLPEAIRGSAVATAQALARRFADAET